MSDSLLGRLARAAHPRLLVLVIVGTLVGVLGTALLLLAPDRGAQATLGRRLAVVGYLVFLIGASGYVAFLVFDRGFD